jgi:diguanylate cyclase (GGDEF)-like protein
MKRLLRNPKVLTQLDIELHRAARKGTPLSFVMIDIDHFKQVNDTWGHAVGDQVLLKLSRLLKERLRRTDIIGRYGGEEFCVVMPETDASQAYQVMDALRQSFEQVVQRAGPNEFFVTFSAGITEADPERLDHLVVDRADKALYSAKQAGRNRIIIAPSN